MHHRTANSLGLKILPLTDCSPRINSQNPANLKIPIDQGGGGGTVKRNSKIHNTHPDKVRRLS